MGFKVEKEIGAVRIEVSEDGKSGVIRNATLLFASVARPYKGKYDPQYKVSIPISGVHKREIKKLAKKVGISEVANEAFPEQYRVAELPFPEMDEQIVLTIAKKAQYKDGNPLKPEHRPRVFAPTAGGKVKDITKTLVGNGSIGDVVFHIVESDEYGSWLDFDAIVVKKLVEYEGGAPSVVSQFDIDGELEKFDDVVAEKADGDDEIPF